MCSPVCLSHCRLEETKLFTNELPKYFNATIKLYISYKLNFEHFTTCLNNMHPSIKFTFEKPEIVYENENKVQVLNFLDVKIILHEDNSVETDIYYKPTNTHDYLPYDSAHSDHTKNNITYNLAKRIMVFVSNPEKVIIRLDELSF